MVKRSSDANVRSTGSPNAKGKTTDRSVLTLGLRLADGAEEDFVLRGRPLGLNFTKSLPGDRGARVGRRAGGHP